jgi:signal transduction histidine kinase
MGDGNSDDQGGHMAIRIDTYYKRFSRNTLFGLFMAQLFAVIISTILIIYFHNQLNVEPTIAIIFGGLILLLCETAIMGILFKIMTEPIKVITQAINHVSKQITDMPPPNINKSRHERSGLKVIVQTIYDLALQTPHKTGDEDAVATGTDSTVSSAAYPGLLDALPCGIIALNEAGEVIYANKQAPIFAGPDHKSQVQLVFEPGKGLTEWLQAASGKVRDSTGWTRIANVLPDQPDRRVFDVVVNYEKNPSSGYETVILTIDRTSDYAVSEEDMDFIALAAHELRGPITVIRGYLDVLNDELAPVMQPDQKDLIERLSVSANRLSGYISNILNVSRYDRRHLKLHLKEDVLADIIESLRPDLEMRARTQNRLLNFTIPADLPKVAADRNSLDEVISNLVDNAIKYSNEGGQVIVTAGVKGDFVEVTVQDFGIGIPGSVVGNLFTKFYRSHRSRSSVSGTGLGLYISKAIVESHGGQVWVRSSEGHGSIFGFSLPIYSTVADKLLASDNNNQGIIENAHGWIKNHSMYRR